MREGAGQQTVGDDENLFQQYAAGQGVFDELRQDPNTPREHWVPLWESFQRHGRLGLAARWENGRRILREHGVSYSVDGDARGGDRPWRLDLVPLLIPAGEWEHIEAGLVQRSNLFNLILSDIYVGSQRLLRDGFIPPELIFANPGFLRPCRGIPVPSQVYLHLHACDLARSPDGRWCVVSDRTQAPKGVGYARENRTVISRVLPEEIRECNVQRLGPFFRRLREMLIELAPAGRPHPGVVLLTPGPGDATYFEHAFLARHLGLPLVEGADLTVRERKVYLKTLEGLQQVDVILRRVDDFMCDPLELRGDSLLGTAGLLEATRAGHVTLANALGSGIMESLAFLPFLPGLCRHLLGEDLILPSVSTWWCGEGEGLRHTLEHLDQLAILPAFGFAEEWSPGSRTPGISGKISGDKAQLRARIEASPRDYVAQERLPLSRVPVWLDDRFEARSVVLRTYVARGPSGCAVLPGGLARVTRSVGGSAVAIQKGGGSKDTWVLSNGSVDRSEPQHVISESDRAARALSGMPSRAADNFFWLGRYTERLDHLLRTLRCVLSRISHEGEGGPEHLAVAELMSGLGLLPWAVNGTVETGGLQQRILELLYQPDCPGGVRELVSRIRYIVSTLRDRFSGDTWRILGQLTRDARARPGGLPRASAASLLHRLVLDLAALQGVEMENMTRGRGWLFLDLGRRIERGLSVLSLLRAGLLVRGEPTFVFHPVLEIADSSMTWRRRYFSEPHASGVWELLILEPLNPRSYAFQLERLEEDARGLSAEVQESSAPERRRVEEMVRDLQTCREKAGQGVGFATENMVRLMDQWMTGLAALSDEITNRYFSHTRARVN